MLLEFIAERFTKIAMSGSRVGARGTGLGSLAVAVVEPDGLELTRGGRRFVLGNSAAVTGIAPVQALPTTAAQWAIFNNESGNSAKSYFLEEIGVFLTSGTPGVGGTLVGCIYQLPAMTGGNTTGVSVAPANQPGNNVASTSHNSRAIVKASQTITTPAAPTWFPLASNPSSNVTAFAASTFLEHRNLRGRIAIPPQHALGLAVVAPAGTTPLFAPFGSWVELEVENE